MIESRSNSRIKKIKKLQENARFRRQEKIFVAEGIKMAEEAAQHGTLLEVYAAEHAKEEYVSRISHKIKGDRMEWVCDQVFREISDTTSPQGILALVQMPEYQRERLVGEKEAAFVCLEDIQDPGNLGTIVRTAEGAGMSAVVLSKGCVDLFHPKVVRATMGAVYRMPFYVTDNMTTEVESLRREGFSFYAAQMNADRRYTECMFQGKTGLLIGNEANGLRTETSECADYSIRIPMEGKLESLNAAVSAALLMYEVHRKRHP